jgi:DNA-binding MarR family transcriptional regulator
MPEQESQGLNGEALRLTADEGLILRAVFQHGPQGRSDLARETHFSRSKVSGLVAKLMDKQILQKNNSDGVHHRKGKISLSTNAWDT